MHDLANATPWVQLFGALVVVALGAFVLSIRPRTRPNVGFAIFAIAFGGQFALTNGGYLAFDVWAHPTFDAPPALEAVRAALRAVAVGGLAAVALAFPAPLRAGERRLLALPIGIAGAVLALGRMVVLEDQFFEGLTPIQTLDLLALFAMTGGLVGLLGLLALRAAASDDPRFASQAALVAGALVLYAGFASTAGFDGFRATSILSPSPRIAAWPAAHLSGVLLAAALWLRASARGPMPRAARNAALATLAAPLAGLAYVAADLDVGALGIVRTLAVAVLAYGIVRHQLLGVDLKVRWTIRQSTIGAIFIAVFFIVSEGASVFFGEDNPYVGVLAAGALVFALAPLQRVAERVALAAVPEGATDSDGPGSAGVGGDREATYRAAVRMALRGGIGRDEELTLARLARDLGLDPHDAVAIRHEVEGPPPEEAAP